MLKLAHIAVVTPNRCGLYETTRELVTALRQAGADSRICDPTFGKNKLHPGGEADRGAKFGDLAWAVDSDIIVNHSGLGEALERSQQPVVHVAHGRPRNSFLTEAKGSTPIYSYQYSKNKSDRFQAVVTFWPQHVDYLKVMWSDTPVYLVQAPVDLKAWSSVGDNGYQFNGHRGTYNAICTDAWREDVDPFVAVNAYALFARQQPEARLHIYGAPKARRGWGALLKTLRDEGTLGEVRGWISQGLDALYRSADCLLTPHVIHVRAIREAAACGCPVLGCPTLAQGRQALQQYFDLDATVRQRKRLEFRAWAEARFDPAQTAGDFLTMLHENF